MPAWSRFAVPLSTALVVTLLAATAPAELPGGAADEVADTDLDEDDGVGVPSGHVKDLDVIAPPDAQPRAHDEIPFPDAEPRDEDEITPPNPKLPD